MNKAAQALGRLGKGVPRNFTPEERAKRAERMRQLNARRRVKAA